MALLPDGTRMPAREFFRLHGAQLEAYPNAQIVLSVPLYQASDNLKNAIKGVVGVASAILASLVLKNPALGSKHTNVNG